MIGETTVVKLFDGVDEGELDEGGDPSWRVALFEVRRDGVVLATLQVTPIDIAVFPQATKVAVIGS